MPTVDVFEPKGLVYLVNHCSRGSYIWWRWGESEYSGLLKTLNLLIFRDAKNAEHGRIAANWNVSGTRDFQPAVQICEEFTSPLSTSYPRVTFACRPTSQSSVNIGR